MIATPHFFSKRITTCFYPHLFTSQASNPYWQGIWRTWGISNVPHVPSALYTSAFERCHVNMWGTFSNSMFFSVRVINCSNCYIYYLQLLHLILSFSPINANSQSVGSKLTVRKDGPISFARKMFFFWYSAHLFVPLHSKHQEQSSSDGLANRAMEATVVSTMWKIWRTECNIKRVWTLLRWGLISMKVKY